MKKSPGQRIGILTSGGLAPGVNAVIAGAATALAGMDNHDVLLGIEYGWDGLLTVKSLYNLTNFTRERINSLFTESGTLLGSSRTKFDISHMEHDAATGSVTGNPFETVKQTANKYHLDGLIVVGGDDTLGQAHELEKRGFLPVVGVARTIDNDVVPSDVTLGFQTACTAVAETTKRMRVDAKAMRRVAVVEAPGRYAGFLALHGGADGGADIILIPEFPIDPNRICNMTKNAFASNGCAVVVVAEGYGVKEKQPQDGGRIVVDGFGHMRKNGAAKAVSAMIAERARLPTYEQVVGYEARNGPPVPQDVDLGRQLGAQAAMLAHENQWGRAVVWHQGTVKEVPLEYIRGDRRVNELEYDMATLNRQNGSPAAVARTLYGAAVRQTLGTELSKARCLQIR